METTDKTFTDMLINSLKTAATELEELRVQLALGKAEARDVFESLKKSFNSKLNELKAEYVKAKNSKDVLPVISALEHLQVQLALGMAATKELFEDQFKNILKEISALEQELKKPGSLNAHASKIQLEIEKFKAKLELISLHFQLKKVMAEYNFEQKKIDFHHKIDELKAKINEKESEAKDKWNFFKKEIDEAYSHLKKAFVH